MIWYFNNSWLSIFTIPLMSFVNVKTFIIFHDCGHNSYSPNKTLNYIIGNITGLFNITSYSWNYRHDTHHATSGNITNKYDYKQNELMFHTLKQYNKFSVFNKWVYRCLKHPIIYFTLVPQLYFFIIQRYYQVVIYLFKHKYSPNLLTLLFEGIFNNVGIYLMYCMYERYGIFYHMLFSQVIMSLFSIIVFFNQHTFNQSYVVKNDEWKQKDSGLKGSSFIQVPYLLKYFTGGIEYHHIHHMNSKIPGYNLQKYHESVILNSSLFDGIKKLSLMDCYNNLWLVLYDEENKAYVTFKQI